MLDKPNRTPPVEEKISLVDEAPLAVSVRFTSQLGNARSVEFGAGVPIEYIEDRRFHHLLTKLSTAGEHLEARYKLVELKQTLEAAYRQVTTNEQQLANYEQQQAAEWEARNKQGPWRPSESQRKQMDNWKNNSQHMIGVVKKLKEDIEEAEAKCR
jgi:midasin (ATPase involved in ribosome maturation)